jgi:hypothetical protein
MYTPVGHCDGMGACDQSQNGSCDAYVCGATACLTACIADLDCAPGFVCRSGACLTVRANGESCRAAVECASGNCTEGVCCAASACPRCSSCALPGRQGSCQPVPAGTACGVTNCANASLMTYTCDASGACVTATADCAPYMCARMGAQACGTSCKGPQDCAPGFACTDGACLPR